MSADQCAAVDQRLRGLPTTRDVAFKSREQAYEDFKQKFKDQPDLVAQTRPDSLPESFTAKADSGFVEAIETVLASSPGVGTVVVTLPSGTKPHSTVGMIVQLRPDVSADQRAAIEAAVHALPDAKPARFESADAARTRLKHRCRKEPALAGPLDRAGPFASYRFAVTVTANSFGSRAYLALDQLPGVESKLPVPTTVL